MTFAIEQAGAGDAIRANLILDVHRRLLSGSHRGENAGKFRWQQSPIEGSECNPRGAAIIPILDPIDVNSGKPIAPSDTYYDLAGHPWSIGPPVVIICR